MKIFSYLILMLVLTSFISKQSSEISSNTDATDILKKTSEKLNSLKEVSYSYYCSINYFSEDYHSEATGATFLDFDKSDTTLGFKFQLENESFKMIYNGNEYFSLDKEDKTIIINNSPKANSVESISFFLNSLITLKKSLLAIIADNETQKKLSDTIINNKSYYLASFVLKNKTLSGLGNFSPITLKIDFTYKIVIDKKSFLPFQVIQTNNKEPKDYVLTTFNEIDTSPNIPNELSWYYSSYNEYAQRTDKRLTIIKQKTVAPSFELPYYDNNNTISSLNFKSEFVLLEFWIKNCGYCVQAVPKLNSIANKFDSKRLEIIGLNSSDSNEQIKQFYQKNKPSFKTLYDKNGEVTKAFGVDAFPQVVLLDKERNVVYSGNLNIEDIEKFLSKK